MRSAVPYVPRRAEEPSWRQHGRRISRRALLIVAIALTGGPLTYIVLPDRVAAEPGAVQTSHPLAEPVVLAGLRGGVVEGGDLLSDPAGIVSSPVAPKLGGELIGWPVSDHTPSTGFGYRSDPFTHRQRWHDGVDLGQPCGDPVQASLEGTVEHAGWAGGYGNRVVLRHAERDGRSFATTYNHLARIDVAVGDRLTTAQVLGRVGSTGRSTACHLHFEVILDGAYVDPMRFLTGDTSKAGLSRRVGSYMPAGLPSPAATTRSARPSPSSPSPSSPSPSSPRATSPSTPPATSPQPTTPSPTPSLSSPATPEPSGSPTPLPTATATGQGSQGGSAPSSAPASTPVRTQASADTESSGDGQPTPG